MRRLDEVDKVDWVDLLGSEEPRKSALLPLPSLLSLPPTTLPEAPT